MKTLSVSLLLIVLFFLASCMPDSSHIVVYPAPEGEPLNQTYRLSVNGLEVPVYNAKIGHENKIEREKAMDDRPHSHTFYDVAGMAMFDLKEGEAKLTVTVEKEITSVKVLPTSLGITPTIKGNTLSFTVDKPQHVTVEVDGEHIRSLHVFVNPEEKDVPDADDPNVIYFGPGIHEVTTLPITDGQTVYVAGGAIVRGVIGEDEPHGISGFSGMKTYPHSTFALNGKNITLRGRGIIDQELVPTHGRSLVVAHVEGLKVEGVVLRNSSTWTLSVWNCKDVHIDNVKILGHRANSDGIDLNASQDVLVENCFLRTLDDLVVVKTMKGTGEAGRIIVRKCVLWNEVAHALSIGAELTQKVEDVLFTDCDIIGDHGREWSLRIYQTDSGWIKNVRFENIRIEESVKFASLWINSAYWTTDAERGHIENVVFKDITVNSPTPLEKGFEFLGYDTEHAIHQVQIQDVTINGQKVTAQDVVMNDYVYDVTVLP